jgi:hypothetical protein
MNVQIKLPEPCEANWNDMQPVDGGRYCNQCCKAVIDFTLWDPEAIATYLLQHAEEKPCGRFNTTHLNRNITIKTHLISQIEQWHTPIWNKWVAVIVICFAVFSTACNDLASNSNAGRSTLTPVDTFEKNIQIIGVFIIDTIPQSDTLSPQHKKAEFKPLQKLQKTKNTTLVEANTSDVLGGAPILERVPEIIKPTTNDTFIGPPKETQETP